MTVAELTIPQPGSGEGWLSPRRARTIGWSAFAAGLGLRVAQLWLVSRLGPHSVRFALDIGVPTFLAAIVLGTASSVVGAIMVARRPANLVGWLYVLTGLIQGIVTLGLAYAALTLATRQDAIGTFFAWLNGVVDYGIPFAFAAIVLALFPDGVLVGPRWRWVVVLAVVGGIVRELEVGFGEPSMVLIAGSTNPYRLDGAAGELLARSSALGVGSLMVETAFVLGAGSLAVRYRSGSLDGRRQIRWFLLAGFVAVLSTVPLVVGTLVPGSLPPGFDAVGVLFAGLTLAPIATLIAITRYRLYEIDRIVNRAVLYGSLTAILAGVFTAAIALGQRLFVALTGEASDAAIVLTTLVVATLYAPLRKRLEAVVDRRFKFDEPVFGAYRDQLDRALTVVDPARAAQRLAREAVEGLGSVGGAVLAEDGTPTAISGVWPVEPVVHIPVSGGTLEIASIAVGPRRDGSPLAAARLEELARVAGLVAEGVSRARPRTQPGSRWPPS